MRFRDVTKQLLSLVIFVFLTMAETCFQYFCFQMEWYFSVLVKLFIEYNFKLANFCFSLKFRAREIESILVNESLKIKAKEKNPKTSVTCQ